MNEKLYPYIYLDLDETLFYTECDGRKIEADGIKSAQFPGEDTWYNSRLRPRALELIEFCRSISICRVLTVSTRDYAEHFCEEFEFGFTSEEIVTRHDHIEYIRDGWGGYGMGGRETAIPLPSMEFSNAILVDNQTADLPNARNKLEWLGVDASRLVTVPEYMGKANDPLDDDERFEELKQQIKSLVDKVMERK